ncbi:hypothetical protein [Reinekea sp.]|uniref:SPOR domain-containing protein n=1 Tax=Reinekea sp. TaxID=1970455 RepID=UPI002A800AF7|nr:hypothetical protein [Reinekea sp.]
MRVLLMSSIFSMLCANALAYDKQMSLYASAAPVRLLEPGLGLSFATTVGNRTVMGLGVLWPEPRESGNGGAQLSLDGRLLYSSERDTHWYPQFGLNWQPAAPLQAWVGLGFQRQWTSELGLFAESLWRPGENEYRLHLGLRLWLDSFQSLDARVRAADPVGVVYGGGRRPVVDTGAVELKVVLAPSAAPQILPDSNGEQPEPPAARVTAGIEPSPVPTPVDAESRATPASNVAPVPNAAFAPNLAAVPSVTRADAQANQWYLQLGLFRHSASVQPLVDDPRLENYQSQLIRWYDGSVPATRLLLGPLNRSDASSLKALLQVQDLNSFLFQQPD